MERTTTTRYAHTKRASGTESRGEHDARLHFIVAKPRSGIFDTTNFDLSDVISQHDQTAADGRCGPATASIWMWHCARMLAHAIDRAMRHPASSHIPRQCERRIHAPLSRLRADGTHVHARHATAVPSRPHRALIICSRRALIAPTAHSARPDSHASHTCKGSGWFHR